MTTAKIKKITSTILIIVGAVLLILEIGSAQKNYYLQALGILCLMSGVFLVNSSLRSRSDVTPNEIVEEEN